MLRVAEAFDPPVPEWLNFPECARLKSQDSAPREQPGHFAQSLNRIRKMAEQVAVIDNIEIGSGPLEIFQQRAANFDTKALCHARRSCAVGLDTSHFIAQRFRRRQKMTLPTSDLQQPPVRAAAFHPPRLKRGVERIEAVRMPVTGKVDCTRGRLRRRV
jgi:hypothetical protein